MKMASKSGYNKPNKHKMTRSKNPITTMQKNKPNKGLSVPLVLVMFLLLFAVIYSCKREKQSPEENLEISQTDLLKKAQQWLKQQNSLPATESTSGINLKTLTPEWSRSSFDYTNEGERVIGIPMGNFNNHYLELNVTVRENQSYGMIKHFLFLSDTEAYLKVYAGNGSLISEGTYNRITHVYSGSKSAPRKSPLYGQRMSGGDENGIPLEQVDIVGTPNPQPPVVIPPGPVTPPTTPPTGGGGSASAPTVPATPTFMGVNVPIYIYLGVFSCGSSAKVTIYADQPVNGSGTPFSTSGDVGHTFISIEQGSIRRVLGFYPRDGAKPDSPSSPMIFVNDSGHSYDVSYGKVVTGDKLCEMLDWIKSSTPDTYNLNSFNCTTWAGTAVNKAGLGVPLGHSNWVGGGGCTPGLLGENLKTSFPSTFGGAGTGPMNSAVSPF